MKKRSKKLLLCSALFCAELLATTAQGQSVLGQVRRENTLRCGAVPRAGFADIEADGDFTGRGIELCRAVALAALGPAGRMAFSVYESDAAFDALREQHDELAFIDEAALQSQHLDQSITPVVTVFADSIGVMVAQSSSVADLDGLQGRRVCVMIGSSAQQALDDRDGRIGLHVARLAFEEDVEMLDAYNAGRCEAAVAERSRLEQMAETRGINDLHSRILPTALAPAPLFAVIPRGDKIWHDLVAQSLAKTSKD